MVTKKGSISHTFLTHNVVISRKHQKQKNYHKHMVFGTYLLHTKKKRLFVVDFFIYLSKYRVPPPFREKKASAMCLALFLLWHLIAGSPLFQVTHHVLKVQMLHWMYNIIRWIPTTNFWYSIPSRVLVWYHGDNVEQITRIRSWIHFENVSYKRMIENDFKSL